MYANMTEGNPTVTKARTFLLIDLAILVAFIVSAISGLVFYIPASVMDMALTSDVPTFLGVTFATWVTVHTYSGLVMIAGGLTHIVLHWHWMIRTAGGMMPWSSRRKARAAGKDAPAFESEAA